MRVITPTGKLLEAMQVEPFAEKADKFNGRIRRTTEPAKSMSLKPTGLKLCLCSDCTAFHTPYVYVGNLKPEKVVEYMKKLFELGYLDLSTLEYQKRSKHAKYAFDSGKSLPYYEEVLDNCPQSPYQGGTDRCSDVFEDEDEYEEEEDYEEDTEVCEEEEEDN